MNKNCLYGMALGWMFISFCQAVSGTNLMLMLVAVVAIMTTVILWITEE